MLKKRSPKKKKTEFPKEGLSRNTELFQAMVTALEFRQINKFKELLQGALAEGFSIDYLPVEYKWEKPLLRLAIEKDRPVVQGAVFKPKGENIVKILLDHGADPNIEIAGENALAYALQNNVSDETISRLTYSTKNLSNTAIDIICMRLIKETHMRERLFRWLKILLAAGIKPVPTNRKYAEEAHTLFQKKVLGDLEQFLADYRILKEEQEKQLNTKEPIFWDYEL